jgi:uncharacterized protein involved in response to NO
MQASESVRREQALGRVVLVFIITGLLFMLLPGTFLGVWNLISISSRHQLDGMSPAWIQAHGHAQIFGWIGTFVIGIGFHSLAKMGRLPHFAVRRAWISWALWTAGATMRWAAGVSGAREWRIALPVSALLELAGFLLFFRTVSRHKPDPAAGPKPPRQPWMLAVVASTFGFLITLLLNAVAAFDAAFTQGTPAIPHALDQRLLAVPVWAFLVPTVWGFNARWLPVFLGLRAPRGRLLIAAVATAFAGVGFSVAGLAIAAATFFLIAALEATIALRIFEPALQPAKINGVHSSFPLFVRLTYVWLFIAGTLTVWAAAADHAGGIQGASRHAVTVGFLAAMVFAIGQKILPAFCGARVLFCRHAMFASLLLLNLGCALRVASEIPAYEGFAAAGFFWQVLPVSAVIELTAVSVFAANLLVTFMRPAPHVVAKQRAFA